jgi:hypothetical protein
MRKNGILLKFFSGFMSKSSWIPVYTTTDLWEAELVRSALLNDRVEASIKSNEYIIDSAGKKKRQYSVIVPETSVDDAQIVINRASVIIANKEKIMREQEELESQIESGKQQDIEPIAPEVRPSPNSEPELIAEKEGVGKIFHYEPDDIYELRVEFDFYKDSHFMNAEEWDEFTNFSAQRQEFFILIREKYPKLSALIKEHKKRADFIKLVEYSYGKSYPPKKRDE